MINSDNLADIRRLYNISAEEKFGFSTNKITDVEARLNVKLPQTLINYYLSLGNYQSANYSHNKLLRPEEIGFSEDGYLMIYRENQGVVAWGIRKEDLQLDNPPVWGNYGTKEDPEWHLEVDRTTNFFLLMAVYNGTLGGLRYNANYFDEVDQKTLQLIHKNWTLVAPISSEKHKIYTHDFIDVLRVSFNSEGKCTAVFVGTTDVERFDYILDTLDIDWSYTSYDDEYWEEE